MKNEEWIILNHIIQRKSTNFKPKRTFWSTGSWVRFQFIIVKLIFLKWQVYVLISVQSLGLLFIMPCPVPVPARNLATFYINEAVDFWSLKYRSNSCSASTKSGTVGARNQTLMTWMTYLTGLWNLKYMMVWGVADTSSSTLHLFLWKCFLLWLK